MEKAKISILQVEKVKRIASVIAKMEGSDVIGIIHVAEALQYHMYDDSYIDPAAGAMVFGDSITVRKNYTMSDVENAISYLEYLKVKP